MNRDLHKSLGAKIAEELGFGKKNAFIFVDGCVGPDSHCDFPHDITKQGKALAKIDKARSLHFLNDEYAFGELGNTLHYLQDIWVKQDNLTEKDLLDDNQVVDLIEQTQLTKEIREQYSRIVDDLLTVERCGIEAWFDHSWGIWHKDYASCVFVFADIVELMLPTLAPTVAGKGKETLQEYVNSETFKKSVKEGFLGSTLTNYCYPKLSGYPAAIYTLASLMPPLTGEDVGKINLNIVYRLSVELARYTLLPSTVFKFKDSWTNNGCEQPLAFAMPKYHVLIKQPVDSVQRQRNLSFYWEAQEFLENWPGIEQEFSQFKNQPENWRIILSGLVRMIG